MTLPTADRRRRGALAVPAVGLVLLLAACSGAAGEAADPTPSAPVDGAGGPPTQRVDDPGRAAGEIVAVDAALVQVRSTDEQTAVTWDDATTFTQTVTAALADVAVGSCVVAIAAPSDVGASSSADDAASGTPLAATTLTITAARDDGTCAGPGALGGPAGGDGGSGGAPTDLPSGAPRGGDVERPEGAPTDLPSGGPVTRAFGGVVSGRVTAVSGTTITVSVAPGPGDADDGTADADGTTDDADDGTADADGTTDRQVVVSDATVYSRTVDADASALVVGRCASVRGDADDSGRITATSVQVTDATAEGCTVGLGGMVRGGPGGLPGAQDEDGTDA